MITKYEHDLHFRLTKIEHPSGLSERYAYEHANATVILGQEFDSVVPNLYAHKNDLARDDLTKVTIEPAGGGVAWVSTFDNERLFNAISLRQDIFGKTTYEYSYETKSHPERNGNPTTITYPSQELPDNDQPLPVISLLLHIRSRRSHCHL